VNSALQAFDHRAVFPWYLSIVIEAQVLADNGMPTREEDNILYRLGDRWSSRSSTR
jgi:hypothetical protein